MQFKATIITAILALSSSQVCAAPINATASTATVTNAPSSSDTSISSDNSTEESAIALPFSPNAIISTVELGDDVAPIVLDDSVFFVNTTKIEAELVTEHPRGLQKREADAWKWHYYLQGQPWKRQEAPAALKKRSADAWSWHHYLQGQPW